MAFKEVSTVIVDLKKWPDAPLTGYYLGSTSYVDPTYWKTQFVHSFRKETGEEVSIYGFTTLDTRMAKVERGVLCQVTYKGTEAVQTKKYGLKDVHQAEVLQDTDRRIEVEHIADPENDPVTPAPAAKAPDAPAAKGKTGAPTKTPAPKKAVDEDLPPF